MACEVSPLAATAQAFSALTLFECTVTNAQMLVDSMPDRELLRALRIANGLHMHIMCVLEPRYDRVCLRSEEHDACLHRRRPAAAATPPPVVVKTKIRAANGAYSSAVAKVESSSPISPQPPQTPSASGNGGGGGGGPVAAAATDADDATDDDFYGTNDCLIVEDDDAALASSAAAAAADFSGLAADSPPGPARKRARQRRQQHHQHHQQQQAAAGSSSSGQGWSGDCKDAIRRAYKEIKGSGPHLFDFALPFTDPVNSHAAEEVITRAMQLQPQLDLPAEVWWSQLCPIELNRLARSEKLWRQRLLMRRLRSKDSKLVRRQKSFELVASGLTTEEFDKFRLILSRDYTSSDEEVGGAADDDGGGGAGGVGSGLRVRELAWESDEVKEMKRKLDDAYLASCATVKQAEQLGRIERGSGCVSGRAPPPDCPEWAVRL